MVSPCLDLPNNSTNGVECERAARETYPCAKCAVFEADINKLKLTNDDHISEILSLRKYIREIEPRKESYYKAIIEGLEQQISFLQKNNCKLRKRLSEVLE